MQLSQTDGRAARLTLLLRRAGHSLTTEQFYLLTAILKLLGNDNLMLSKATEKIVIKSFSFDLLSTLS